MKATHAMLAAAATVLTGGGIAVADGEFASAFPSGVQRVWAGPEYWTNPMEDWQIANGRLEVVRPGPNRNVHILTRQLGRQAGTLEMSVLIGRADNGAAPRSAGFRVGIRSELGDYRSAVFHGRGIDAGIADDGSLFIASPSRSRPQAQIGDAKVVKLCLTAKPAGARYALTLVAKDPASGTALGKMQTQIRSDRLVGNLALVNDYGFGKKGAAGKKRKTGPPVRHWFDDWRIAGTKVVAHDDQAFGPILFSQYTLSRRVMKMTAQMAPIGKADPQTVDLQLKTGDGWKTVGTAPIHALARTATFRIEGWDDTKDIPYRLVYRLTSANGKPRDHCWSGTVRREPTGRKLVVAGFTGNTDAGFPNARVARNVAIHNPDLLFFSGDQIYEQVGGYGIHRTPVDVAVVNYLRKWIMWGWAFRDVTRDRPTVCMPDDHDVYQGNIWGNGGNPIAMRDHPCGGYAMHPDFVNAVHLTQTSHLPDPYDATPIKQGISVYYCDLRYGRVSFAIIADRMFKSGPQGTVATWEGRPDWVKDTNFDPKIVDKPGLKLLGDRQLKFLDAWAADWTGVDMKAVLSQTILCNLANYHGAAKTFLVADLDSNGWPQSGRNRALRALRRGFAFHLAGDQHLASIVHHGIDAHGDAGYSFCVPSIAAGYPRSWRPDQEGRPVKNRPAGGLPNTGEYLDGLGNRVTVHAIGNPEAKNRPGALNTLHDKASGYGLVRFDRQTRQITIECWRLLVDVADPKPGDQFPGWPKTIDMLDNYARRAHAWLPTVRVAGMSDPVVQVIDESDGKIVYTLRIKGTSFRPKVFKDGSYTVRVGEPSAKKVKTFKGVRPAATGSIDVAF